MTKDNLIKAWDKESNKLLKYLHDNECLPANFDEVVISFTKKQIEDAIEKGYKQRDNEIIGEENLAEAEDAHRTTEGYCCACGYDMAVMESKIKEAIEKTNKRWEKRNRDVKKLIENVEVLIAPSAVIRVIGIDRTGEKHLCKFITRTLSDLLEHKESL